MANPWMALRSVVLQIQKDNPKMAQHFWGSSRSFVRGAAIPGLAATPLKGYTSYAQFAQDIKNNLLPPGSWVGYDLEKWAQSPTAEQLDPLHYLEAFTDLGHDHQLKVMLTPGVDLCGVQGSPIYRNDGESLYSAYVRTRVAAACIRADIYECQAQGLQKAPNPMTYREFLESCASQITTRAETWSGLTTDRGDAKSVIEHWWQESRYIARGYWMNTTSATIKVAEDVMAFIMAHDA